MSEKCILIVDDEELIRQNLRLDLTDLGYGVDLAASGEEAAALLERDYDLIITDLLMEGMSGLEVLRQAKGRRHGQAVFILTGHGELESAIHALRLGADDYLLKPYNHDELVLRIGRCLAEQELRQKVSLYERLLSICSDCKKIRDPGPAEEGKATWVSIEEYLCKTTGSDLSHGICPDCYQKKVAELKAMIRGGRFSSPA